MLAAAGAERPINYVWLGAFAGSLIRPVGGMLADRFTGSVVSFWNFVAMTVASAVVLVASRADSIPVFVIVFTLLFVLTGIGNGSVYKMIPAIFHAEVTTRLGADADPAAQRFQARRLASALVGVAGAIGAFGGVLVQLAFRQSFLSLGTGTAAYTGFIVFYAVCAVVTYVVYIRKSESSLVGV